MNIKADELDKRVISEYLQQYQSIGYVPDFETIEVLRDQSHVTVRTENKSFTASVPETRGILMDESERLIFYEFFREYFKKSLDWGILSGVKPVKLYRKIEKTGLDPDKILTEEFFISPKKVELLKEINQRQRDILDAAGGQRNISIYLGIPICPQRCSYCSFVSTVLDSRRILLTDYLKALEGEIRETAKIVRENNLIVDSFYIGGGTPSILTPEEAQKLLIQLGNAFDFNSIKEFTFEAGRPETTTKELLYVLKEFGVNRICLNPQTMNQETLYAINRNHTVSDIEEKYQLMRDIGFESINMDLIAGLNNEPEQAFLYSLNRVIDLSPDNLTVHNLSVKKGSRLNELYGKTVSTAYSDSFFNKVAQTLRVNHYDPYYLYRQKYTIGNGENIGYTKPHKESWYNILMMAEEQTILGIGAGSSGKLYDRSLDRFSHVYTVKDIRTYNKRSDEIIERKVNAYKEFYNEKLCIK